MKTIRIAILWLTLILSAHGQQYTQTNLVYNAVVLAGAGSNYNSVIDLTKFEDVGFMIYASAAAASTSNSFHYISWSGDATNWTRFLVVSNVQVGTSTNVFYTNWNSLQLGSAGYLRYDSNWFPNNLVFMSNINVVAFTKPKRFGR